MPATPTKFTYVADTTRPAVLAASYRIYTVRLTSQLTPRNKVSFHWDEQQPCEGGAAPASRTARAARPGHGLRLRRLDRPADAVGLGDARRRTRPRTGITACACNRPSGPRRSATTCCSTRAWGSYKSHYGGVPIPGLDTTTWCASPSSARPAARTTAGIAEPDLPVAHLFPQHQLEHAVERECVVRDRQPEHQVRLPGRATSLTIARSANICTRPAAIGPITASPIS